MRAAAIAACGDVANLRALPDFKIGMDLLATQLREITLAEPPPVLTLPQAPSTPATRCRRSSAAQARTRHPRQPAEAATPSNYIFCAATPAPGLRPLSG